jgi:hypothetical protein
MCLGLLVFLAASRNKFFSNPPSNSMVKLCLEILADSVKTPKNVEKWLAAV